MPCFLTVWNTSRHSMHIQIRKHGGTRSGKYYVHSVPLAHVDTMRIIVKKPFNFRYTVWKPSHFATGLEQHSKDMSWRTFRVGELLCGVVLQMEGDDTLRAEVYAVVRD